MKRSRLDEKIHRDLRARLEALNKKMGSDKKPAVTSADQLKAPPGSGRKHQPEADRPEPVLYSRKLPRVSGASDASGVPSEAVALEDAVAGEVWEHETHGRAYIISTVVDDVAGAETLNTRFRDRLTRPDPGLAQQLNRVKPIADVELEDFLFMDIETTGLGNTPVFLVGVMLWNEGGFEVKQYLARNYAEEKAVVLCFIEACTKHPLLVTFNGKSFDFPFLRTRAAAARLPFDLAPDHLDLLHVGRRLWKKQLPNCKLQTLESHICGRSRHGDIPGSQIPEAYHRYVRTEDAGQIVRILEHNLLDLVTLADLMTHFPAPMEA